MCRPQPSPGPMALLSARIADRGYANYDIEGPFPQRQYLVRLYAQDGLLAWAFKGTLAELQSMIATIPRWQGGEGVGQGWRWR